MQGQVVWPSRLTTCQVLHSHTWLVAPNGQVQKWNVPTAQKVQRLLFDGSAVKVATAVAGRTPPPTPGAYQSPASGLGEMSSTWESVLRAAIRCPGFHKKWKAELGFEPRPTSAQILCSATLPGSPSLLGGLVGLE